MNISINSDIFQQATAFDILLDKEVSIEATRLNGKHQFYSNAKDIAIPQYEGQLLKATSTINGLLSVEYYKAHYGIWYRLHYERTINIRELFKQ